MERERIVTVVATMLFIFAILVFFFKNVLGESNNNVYLSSRNLKRSKAVTASELNTYALMNANSVVLFEGTVEGVVSNLSK